MSPAMQPLPQGQSDCSQQTFLYFAKLLGMKRALIFILCCASFAVAQSKYFSSWPSGADPREVGHRVAIHFVESGHQNSFVDYPEVCTWHGALVFAKVTGDDALRAKLDERLHTVLARENAKLVPDKEHVDFDIFGSIPLEHSLDRNDAHLRAFGLKFADRQWSHPTADGLSNETRFWIDDMYMITLLETSAYRATRDRKYLDRAALEMVAYLDKLQQPNGLFFHAPDVPFFWGRGDGWVAAGMTEMLKQLPADHPQRARILAGYRNMMSALLQNQATDGMWRQLIDHPESWPESSSSAMFAYALISGVKHGWLEEEKYGPAARKAWIAVAGYVDQNADVTNVCEGTGKNNDYAYYLARKRRTGDFHGQAPVLWAATALLE